MGRFKDFFGSINKNGSFDRKPDKPHGDSYGRKSGYFEQERWRREKNDWKDRQTAREKRSGRVEEGGAGKVWVDNAVRDWRT